MNTTYVQKNSTVQKIADSKAASVLDSSAKNESLQHKADMANNAAQRAEAPRPNNTGMPDNLKAGIESLSGFSMDDVRVHYNSSKPATVQALAYTQGTDIHVAPGQEKHLPHEAWHVAQQMAGRVSPTTNINGMPVNDNASLEHEADVMGEKAVQCKGLKYRSHFSLEKNNIGSAFVQRKIEIGELTSDQNRDEIVKILKENYESRFKDLFNQVLEKMPLAVKNKCQDKDHNNIFFTNLYKWIACSEQTYTYANDEIGWSKLIKDVFKYYFYKEHNWEAIGVGEYMTGDVTGLGIAASINPYITLKILPYKSIPRIDTPSFFAPKLVLNSDQNPAILRDDYMLELLSADNRSEAFKVPALFRELLMSNQLRYSEKNADSGELYDKRFKPYDKKYPLKPWNKETWFATKVIGDKYGEKKEEIQKLLLPDEEENKNDIPRVKEYKKRKIAENKKCILLWQRRSGIGGGAHKELDSHPVVIKQIAKTISDNFGDRIIILIGDGCESINEQVFESYGVSNQIIMINQYWKDSGVEDLFSNRNNQNYFLKLLSDENDAVSIGMRSGSLESSALLGIKTIFIDDLGNNAQHRMEYWAGSAAYLRSKYFKDWMYEWTFKGPIPNYKRLATRSKLGMINESFGKSRENLYNCLYQMNEIINKKQVTENAAGNDAEQKFLGVLEQTKKIVENINGNLQGKDIIQGGYSKLISQLNDNHQNLNAAYRKCKFEEKTELYSGDKNEMLKRIKDIMDGLFLSENELNQLTGLISFFSSQPLLMNSPN